MQENLILQNNQRAAFCVAGGNANPDPVHLFAENFDVEMWNSDRIMELDGKFRNKSFCCIKGPKCGSSHFFLHLSLLQKYYTHIYIENHKLTIYFHYSIRIPHFNIKIFCE
jgi:hypothetical protein